MFVVGCELCLLRIESCIFVEVGFLFNSEEEIFTITSSDSASAAKLYAGGENVTAFTFAKHGGVMIINRRMLKRLHVFLC